MSSWLHRTDKAFIPRCSPRDMEARYPADAPFVGEDGNAVSNAAWIWKPDLSAVVSHPARYWKVVGDGVELMAARERDAVDAAEADADAVAKREAFRQDERFRAVVKVFASETGLSESEALARIDAATEREMDLDRRSSEVGAREVAVGVRETKADRFEMWREKEPA